MPPLRGFEYIALIYPFNPLHRGERPSPRSFLKLTGLSPYKPADLSHRAAIKRQYNVLRRSQRSDPYPTSPEALSFSPKLQERVVEVKPFFQDLDSGTLLLMLCFCRSVNV